MIWSRSRSDLAHFAGKKIVIGSGSVLWQKIVIWSGSWKKGSSNTLHSVYEAFDACPPLANIKPMKKRIGLWTSSFIACKLLYIVYYFVHYCCTTPKFYNFSIYSWGWSFGYQIGLRCILWSIVIKNYKIGSQIFKLWVGSSRATFHWMGRRAR